MTPDAASQRLQCVIDSPATPDEPLVWGVQGIELKVVRGAFEHLLATLAARPTGLRYQLRLMPGGAPIGPAASVALPGGPLTLRIAADPDRPASDAGLASAEPLHGQQQIEVRYAGRGGAAALMFDTLAMFMAPIAGGFTPPLDRVEVDDVLAVIERGRRLVIHDSQVRAEQMPHLLPAHLNAFSEGGLPPVRACYGVLMMPSDASIVDAQQLFEDLAREMDASAYAAFSVLRCVPGSEPRLMTLSCVGD